MNGKMMEKMEGYAMNIVCIAGLVSSGMLFAKLSGFV